MGIILQPVMNKGFLNLPNHLLSGGYLGVWLNSMAFSMDWFNMDHRIYVWMFFRHEQHQLDSTGKPSSLGLI